MLFDNLKKTILYIKNGHFKLWNIIKFIHCCQWKIEILDFFQWIKFTVSFFPFKVIYQVCFFDLSEKHFYILVFSSNEWWFQFKKDFDKAAKNLSADKNRFKTINNVLTANFCMFRAKSSVIDIFVFQFFNYDWTNLVYNTRE